MHLTGRTDNTAPTKCKHGAKPGDLIEISRGLYQHWVVYIGNDKIVHLTLIANEKAGAQVQMEGPGMVSCENIWKVIGDSDFKVNNQLDDKYESHNPETIVKEALVMVGEEIRYSLISYNCEHFATELRYGKKESRQVRRATTAAVLASVLIPASVSTSQGSSALTTSAHVSAGVVSA